MLNTINIKIKLKLKKLFKKTFRIRNQETISDGIERHKTNFKNLFIFKNINKEILEQELLNSGIKEGDTIIVHCSWRAMKSFKGSPNNLIDILLKIIGDSGNLLMPSYGNNKTYFDIRQTHSKAGVLSEIFRTQYNIERSLFPDSSMICLGKNANEIVDSHKDSVYAFDEFSPYSISINKFDAKILLLGLGLNPHKITAFHLSSFYLRKSSYIYSKKIDSKVINEYGNLINKTIIDRIDGCRNNKRVFRHLFSKLPKYTYQKNLLNFHLFNGKDALKVSYDYIKNGGEIYNFDNTKL